MWEIVRKLKLEHCDLPTMIQNLSTMMRGQALNIDPRNTKRIPIIFYLITGISGVCYFYTYLFSVLWFEFVVCPQTGDLVAAMVVLSLGVSSEIAAVLLGNLFFMRKTVMDIVSHYLDWDALVPVDSRFSNNLHKVLRSVKMRAMFFWVLINVNGLIYIMVPLFLPGKHFSQDYMVIYGLEPMTESPNYEIASLLLMVSVLSNCFAIGNTVAFFVIFTGYPEGRILSLTEEIHHVWDDAVMDHYDKIGIKPNSTIVINARAKKEINREINKRLIIIIQEHVTVINAVARLEQLFKLPVSIGLVCLSIALCAEMLGGLQNTYLQVPYTVSQVLVECWVGQKLKDAGEAFTKAVYSCRWENFDNNNMKLVLLMLQVSQNNLTLTAGGVVPLSFALAMTIIRSTYSTYTALRTVM